MSGGCIIWYTTHCGVYVKHELKQNEIAQWMVPPKTLSPDPNIPRVQSWELGSAGDGTQQITRDPSTQ